MGQSHNILIILNHKVSSHQIITLIKKIWSSNHATMAVVVSSRSKTIIVFGKKILPEFHIWSSTLFHMWWNIPGRTLKKIKFKKTLCSK